MATQSPPIHRAGGAGGALGNPIGLSGPPPACRLPVRRSRRTTTGFPRPHPPPRPLRGARGRIDDSRGEALVCDLTRLRAPNLPTTRWLEFGRDRRSISRESFDARLGGPTDARGGRERRCLDVKA